MSVFSDLRIRYEAVFKILYSVHLLALLFDGIVVVNESNTSMQSHLYRHFRLRDLPVQSKPITKPIANINRGRSRTVSMGELTKGTRNVMFRLSCEARVTSSTPKQTWPGNIIRSLGRGVSK
eukprot:COSAG05_NODE_2625_length_2828_cov_2.465005_2_plen_122_part_00